MAKNRKPPTYKDPCAYCGSKVELRMTSKHVYGGRDFGPVWTCSNYPTCDAYVGVHKSSNQPLGRVANKELRKWKKDAHALFDPLWRLKQRREGLSKKKARDAAYTWLAEQLGIEKDDCHIGMFDVDMCKRVVDVCRPHLQRLKIGPWAPAPPMTTFRTEGKRHEARM